MLLSKCELLEFLAGELSRSLRKIFKCLEAINAIRQLTYQQASLRDKCVQRGGEEISGKRASTLSARSRVSYYLRPKVFPLQ